MDRLSFHRFPLTDQGIVEWSYWLYYAQVAPAKYNMFRVHNFKATLPFFPFTDDELMKLPILALRMRKVFYLTQLKPKTIAILNPNLYPKSYRTILIGYNGLYAN